MEEWNHGLPFRRPTFVYNNKRPVILSFRSFRILGQHWAEIILTLFTLYIISLTRYAPKPPLCVTPFFYAMFIVSVQANKGRRSRKVVKHPSYCLFTRESRALEYRFSLHNWRFMSQKARRTRYFPRVCLAWLRKLLLCRLNLYVGGLCGSVTVDSSRLIIKTTPRNKS